MSSVNHVPANRSGLFELEQRDFWVRPHSHGRTPSANAPGREDQKLAESVQAMNVKTIDSGGNPGGRRKLSTMRVSTNLERNPCLFGNRQPMRRMDQQNAGPFAVDRGGLKYGAKPPRIDSFAVVDANDLHAFDVDFFVM